MDKFKTLFPLYLEELQALSDFVSTYHVNNNQSGLNSGINSEDPDVLRLLESLAFFSARTHDAALRNIIDNRRRLFYELFPFFLSELPDIGILCASVTGGLTAPEMLDKGLRFELTTMDSQSFHFETDHHLYIAPMRISDVRCLPSSAGGSRLYIDIKTLHPLQRFPDELQFYLDYTGDVFASFRLRGYLQDGIRSAKLLLNPPGDYLEQDEQDWLELPRPVFGLSAAGLEDDDYLHPIERERLFFREPRVALFWRFDTREVHSPCTRMRLLIQLESAPPKGVVLNRDIFHLFCVPAVNMKKDYAAPIHANGMDSRYPLLPVATNHGFVLFKTLGVYRLLEQGMAPLVPGVVSDVDGSYEIDMGDIQATVRRPLIYLKFPGAFADDRVVIIDGLWLQPGYYPNRELSCSIRPFTRVMDGVQWEWMSIPPSHRRPALSRDDGTDSGGMHLDLLALTHKRFLSFTDVKLVMHAIGPMDHGPFSSFYYAFTGIRHELRSIQGEQMAAGYIVYYMAFDWGKVDRLSMLFRVFLEHMETVLNHLSLDRRVTLVPDVDSQTGTRGVAA
ncbi:MAG: hypothetical protein RIQ52_643 [Pseudomonadota bacterium]|jgi:type VI secretion system protein ImpG